jgi:phosphate transport system substrate-binding protein
MHKQKHLAALAWMFLCVGAWAQQTRVETHSKPEGHAHTIRVTGDPAIAKLLNDWERQFRVEHPEVTFTNRLAGPASSMAGLYTGTADLAFAGHELLTSESMAFEWIFHYKALPIEVSSGSLDGPNFAPAFFVAASNPLSALTLAQADSVLGCEHRVRGKVVRTWGDLGLTGDWSDKPIHIYGYDPESEIGVFIRRKVLNNDYKWNCEVTTFGGLAHSAADGASKEILQALRADRYGLAISNVRYTSADLKTVPLARPDESQPVALSAENLVTGQYPLARPFFVYINRKPGQPADEVLSAFLRFVLSREGQQQVAESGTFLPLSDAVAHKQAGKLE